jgi:hypothetical protein
VSILGDTPEWLAEDAAEADVDGWGMLDENYYPAEELEEELDLEEDFPRLAEVLREALREDYEDAPPEEMENALAGVLEAMTPAESFNLTKALRQVEKGAAQTLADPAVGQIASTALPLAGAAAGTYFGGPAGTAIGSQLGGAAAKSLSGAKPTPPAAPGSSPLPPAAKGLVLTQDPRVLKTLLALAMGEHGRKSIDGVPIGRIMNLLSTVFNQAAADADELLYSSGETSSYLLDDEGAYLTGPERPADRADALYTTLLDAENEHFAEAMREW